MSSSTSKPANEPVDDNPFHEFSSPATQTIQGINDGLLSVSFEILDKTSTHLKFKTIVSNESAQVIDGVSIKLAVSKANQLELKPQNSDVLRGSEKGGITQEATVTGESLDKVSVKYMVEYSFGQLSGVVKLV